MSEAAVKIFELKKRDIFLKLQLIADFLRTYDNTKAREKQGRLQSLETIRMQFEEMKEQAYEKIENEEVLEGIVNDTTNFDCKYHEMKAALQDPPRSPNLESTRYNPCSETQHTASFNASVRLPKVDLPSFNGDITKWLSFKDRFESMVHDASDIPDVTKLQYLLSSLTGPLATQFEHTPITADSYITTWDALLKRFDNTKRIKREYFLGIHNLKRMSNNSVHELQRVVNEVTRLVRGLERLKAPVEHWDIPLTNMLLYKLDEDTVWAWEKHAADITEDKFTDLIKFLEKRITVQLNHRTNQTSMVAGRQVKVHRNIALPIQVNETNQNINPCIVCGEPHNVNSCPKFEAFTIPNREEFVKEQMLCFNCLRKGHSVRNCKSKFVCKHCKDRHHSKLCNRNTATTNEEIKTRVPSVTATAYKPKHKRALLSTVQLYIDNVHKKPCIVRALIDSGSQTNFITDKLAKQLGLRGMRLNEPVSGIGGSVMHLTGVVASTIRSRISSYQAHVEFLVLPKITSELPTQAIDISHWNIPNTIQLADSEFFTPNQIDMLLGVEIFVEILKGRKMKIADDYPCLLETELGWIIGGPYKSHPAPANFVCALSTRGENAALSNLLETFFNIEDVGEERVLSQEERECEKHFIETSTRDSTGRIIVRLPFKPNVELGESKQIALRRFAGLERKFAREPEMFQEYISFMKEYEEMGHMTRVDTQGATEGKEYYMPHHAVFKQDSLTTKCRVVFDASCKTSNGLSLNDALKVGPTIQQDTTSILLRWRTRAIAVTADVAKMYRQVWVHPEDRQFQRILWRSNPDEPIETFELNTVTYGTAAAPFLAIRALNRVIEDHQTQFPLAASRREDFYVDDLITGAGTEEEARQLCLEAKSLLARGGFPLRKWASNCPQVLPDATNDPQTPVMLYESNSNSAITTLGLVWNPDSDTLSLRVPEIERERGVTRRSVYRTVARIYDPLGIIDTVKAKAKQFMQYLWILKHQDNKQYGWDEELPRQLCEEWKLFESQLIHLKEIKVPRQVLIANPVIIQLHGFGDASESGFGACVYVRSIDSTGAISSRLFVSKSKVAPLSKKHTIARLELCAAHLLSKLLAKVKKSTKTDIPTYCWTDSTTVLYWLKSSPNRWKTFVANRVSQIHCSSQGLEWRHVPGAQNPADAVSRGRFPTEIITDTLWWNGPDWLKMDETFWPNYTLSNAEDSVVLEEERITCALTSAVEVDSFINRACGMSNTFEELKQIVSYVLKFFDELKGDAHQTETDEVTALQRAEKVIMRLVQRHFYAKEIESLKQGRLVSRSSPLKLLSPIYEGDGPIRVGGRLNNSDIDDEHKHPIIVPGKHRISMLVAQHYHKMLLHGGVQIMLNTIQQKYWIVGGRNVVKSVIHNCIRCTRCKPKLLQQPMADLPLQRVRQARPFSISGVDYAGPIMMKGTHRRAASRKGYICLFVCFVTKAVHIELVSDLTSLAFLAALRRFVARRGLVAELHSDNGTNFKGACGQLEEVYELLNSQEHREKTTRWCAEQGIKWSFIPPGAPHFGGLWEAAVKSMKHHMIRVLGNGELTFEDMSTLMVEIEACLNSRPLVPASNDPNDLEALTPGHFLVGTNLQCVPQVDITDIPSNRLNHWRQVQRYTQLIWRRWYQEYLHSLQKRTKWNNSACSIEVGRLVIVKEENVPICKWPLARISQVHPGADNVIRVVTLRFANGKEVQRPITKIAILPVTDTN